MKLDVRAEEYVSVIIPTSNSAKKLPPCLKSVENQLYPYKEVVVVDNYSNDDTRGIAKRLGANVILHKGTQAAARNVGLCHSKSGYVLFLDSDQRLEMGVLENCVLKTSTNHVEAVKIPEVFIGLNFWGACSGLWKNSMVKAWGPQGGIPRFYVRKSLTNNLEYNDALRWWEDMELYQRLKLRGLNEAWCDRKICHFESDSLHNTVSKYLSYGQSITAFGSSSLKAPYAQTLKLTFSAVAQTLKAPGKSLSVFIGCLFLVTVKGLSATFGLLSKLK